MISSTQDWTATSAAPNSITLGSQIGDGMSNEAKKYDVYKVKVELLSPIALIKIAEVLTFGAKKYDAHNWRKGFVWSRQLGAALRHLLAYMGGQDKDPESGLSHLSHLGCCVMFLLEFEETHKNLDDRYKASDKIDPKSERKNPVYF